METIDLSSFSEKREFRKEITLGKEKGRLVVSFLPPDSCYLSVKYSDQTKLRWRTYEYSYPLKEVPAKLTRGLVRLGASDAFMLRLQAAYAQILASVSGVRHDQLHTDTGSEYDF